MVISHFYLRKLHLKIMGTSWVKINFTTNEWLSLSYDGTGPVKAASLSHHVTKRKVCIAICWQLYPFTQRNDNPKRKKFSIRLRHMKKSASAQPLPSTSPWVAE